MGKVLFALAKWRRQIENFAVPAHLAKNKNSAGNSGHYS